MATNYPSPPVSPTPRRPATPSRWASSWSISDLTVSIPSTGKATLNSDPAPSRWRTKEFCFYYAVFVVVVPYMARAVVRLSSSSHPNYHRFSHRLKPGWIMGWPVDVSDHQWNTFRSNLPLLLIIAVLQLGTTQYLTRRHPTASVPQRERAILTFALPLMLLLHGSSLPKMLVILWLNYTVARKAPPLVSWSFNLAILFANEIWEGYQWGSITPMLSFLDEGWVRGVLPRWHINWNITMLRLISFNMDYHWACTSHPPVPETSEKMLALDERTRTASSHPLAGYTFTSYLSYALYPPLYLAGPIMTYNAFRSQLVSPPSLSRSTIVSYAFRFLACLGTMELVGHTMYVVAIKDSSRAGAWMGDTPFELSMIGFWNLIVVWLKLLIPWRFFRLWALIDGIDPPENMVRCMANNYSTSGFWRSWHRSYNLWVVRYIYVPIGGASNALFATLVVFTFVALWHDLSLKLLTWGWVITLFVLPEMAGQKFVSKAQYGSTWWYRHLTALGGVFNILLMMTANLIGFAIGTEGTAYMWGQMVSTWQGLKFMVVAIACLFIAVQVMFEYREEERRKGIYKLRTKSGASEQRICLPARDSFRARLCYAPSSDKQMEPESIFVDPAALFSINGFNAEPALSMTQPQDLLVGSSQASGSAALSPQTKPSEKENKKEKACAPCRVRRVRCDRIPGQVDCIKCQEKKIACVPWPKPESRKRKTAFPARSGKRIEEAIALYGTRNDRDESMEQISTQTMVQEQQKRVSKLMSNTFGSLQQMSAVNRLSGAELQASTLTSLLDFYLYVNPEPNAALECIGFREMYEACGRRVENLPLQSQVLASVVVAVAARNSDHPILVGANGPNAAEVCDRALEGRSMMSFGRNREAACMDLQKRAVKFVDESGTLRRPSVESIATLQLLEVLLSPMKFLNRNDLESDLEAYASAYIAHTRTLLWRDNGPEERKRLDVVAWLAYNGDCKVAIQTGRQPVVRLQGGMENPQPLHEIIHRHTEDVDEDIRRITWSIMWGLNNYAKQGPVRLTSLKARRSPLFDVKFVREYLEYLRAVESAIPDLERRKHDLERRQAHKDMCSRGHMVRISWGTIRYLKTSIAATAFGLHHLVCRRLLPNSPFVLETERRRQVDIVDWWPHITTPHPTHGDAKYWDDLNALSAETNAMCLHSVRVLARIFEERLTKRDPGVSGCDWMDSSAIQQMFSRLTWWLSLLITAPTLEEGGNTPGLDFANKLEELGWIHRAVISFGWSFEELGKNESWVAEEISKIEEARIAHYAASAFGGQGGDTSSSVDLSASTSPFSYPSSSSFSTPSLDMHNAFSSSDAPSTFDLSTPLFTDFHNELGGGLEDADPFSRVTGLAPMMSDQELNDLLSTDFGFPAFGDAPPILGGTWER